jgi:hypothetical protein
VFHSSPTQILRHVDEMILCEEHELNWKEQLERTIAVFEEIENYCRKQFKTPTALRLLATTRSLLDARVLPTPELYKTNVLRAVSPEEFLLDEVTTTAVHIAEVYGVSRPEAAALIRSSAISFAVDRSSTLDSLMQRENEATTPGMR